jgi:hypothetical protein
MSNKYESECKNNKKKLTKKFNNYNYTEKTANSQFIRSKNKYFCNNSNKSYNKNNDIMKSSLYGNNKVRKYLFENFNNKKTKLMKKRMDYVQNEVNKISYYV